MPQSFLIINKLLYNFAIIEFFTMESVGDIFSETFKIALFVKEVGRYLCFKKGRLVGMVGYSQHYDLAFNSLSFLHNLNTKINVICSIN